MFTKRIAEKFCLLFVLFSISYLGTTLYRNYIYLNKIDDYHLADVFPSLFCVPVAFSFGDFFLCLRGRDIANRYLAILYCTIGFVVYELIEIPFGGFDWFDIAAIFIGASITAAVVLFGNKRKEP